MHISHLPAVSARLLLRRLGMVTEAVLAVSDIDIAFRDDEGWKYFKQVGRTLDGVVIDRAALSWTV